MPQQFAQSQHQNSDTSENQKQQCSEKMTSLRHQQDALDAVLDDISSTLETDAEEYVSSFVQKGGE
ncbi:ubiquitin-like protein Pup [Bifidobacterium commune]|uniref:Prokaryotic ubiquitin-like protein Pup n=1 Tax=Bifidobacterium commune TaxID=1505727 RepID=A0A1C4H1S7_9BIFI|nr:ubiquitin-like protein Pup [Bifidobacterium commune]MBB2954675.1 ubiquitin-like protein Pup [Bifidobacterium commune]SCC78530.1 prokaryotic ubiquitin-like protein Pup [Bifidobacterium commune]